LEEVALARCLVIAGGLANAVAKSGAALMRFAVDVGSATISMERSAYTEASIMTSVCCAGR
jgi:hypothetical protein